MAQVVGPHQATTYVFDAASPQSLHSEDSNELITLFPDPTDATTGLRSQMGYQWGSTPRVNSTYTDVAEDLPFDLRPFNWWEQTTNVLDAQYAVADGTYQDGGYLSESPGSLS